MTCRIVPISFHMTSIRKGASITVAAGHRFWRYRRMGNRTHLCWPPLTGLCMVESSCSLLSHFLSQFEEVALCEASSSGECVCFVRVVHECMFASTFVLATFVLLLLRRRSALPFIRCLLLAGGGAKRPRNMNFILCLPVLRPRTS